MEFLDLKKSPLGYQIDLWIAILIIILEKTAFVHMPFSEADKHPNK